MANFIKGAIKHPGALHAELGIPQGKTIPRDRLAKAAKAGGTLGRRARFAETLEGLHHGGAAKKKATKPFAFSGIMGGK